jgi:NMD protein affecting ribosome stability and mRNA decay
MNRKESRPGSKNRQRARYVQPKDDTSKAKGPETLVCDACRVVQHGGRWFWGAPPDGHVRGGLCPACQRIRDRYPAGTIRVPASLLEPRDEIVHLIRNVEEAEKNEHPLERIMDIEERNGGLVVTTTGMHVARRIADRLERRFHKKPRMHYEEENLLRLEWEG